MPRSPDTGSALPLYALAAVLALAAVAAWVWNRLPDVTPEQLAAWRQEQERNERASQPARERHNDEGNMGDFRITIEAVGGHGCDRTAKEGERLQPCNRMGCPDCETRRFIGALKGGGTNVKLAELTHWPADARGEDGKRIGGDDPAQGYQKSGEVLDDLAKGIRASGNFGS